jgi:hypothetical protein
MELNVNALRRWIGIQQIFILISGGTLANLSDMLRGFLSSSNKSLNRVSVILILEDICSGNVYHISKSDYIMMAEAQSV